MAIIIKGIFALFWLAAVPLASGHILMQKKENLTLAEAFLAGYSICFFLFEILVLPSIYFHISLNLLSGIYGLLSLLLSAAGCWIFWKNRAVTAQRKRKKISLPMAAALLCIFVQVVIVVVFAHMDADDSFYVGTATTAWETNTVFAVNPYTGNEYLYMPRRYVLSPFPIFLAVAGRLCLNLHPAIMAHVIFPAVFLPLCYMAVFQSAKKWAGEDEEKPWLFLLFAAVLIWFSGYSVYNAGNFQMVRIWQGKALLAGGFLPLLFHYCSDVILEEKPVYPRLLLFCAVGACGLLSSMGIMLAPVMVGIFLLLGLLKYRDLKRTALDFLCCLPSLVLGVIYILL